MKAICLALLAAATITAVLVGGIELVERDRAQYLCTMTQAHIVELEVNVCRAARDDGGRTASWCRQRSEARHCALKGQP